MTFLLLDRSVLSGTTVDDGLEGGAEQTRGEVQGLEEGGATGTLGRWCLLHSLKINNISM